MKKLLLLFMCAITMMGFSSCSEDEKITHVDVEDMVGTWNNLYDT